uniref:Pro-Pol polyprotein n=1 Tax=Feline foamy virus TaxID=53182 RepID=A0A5J6DHK3_FFV|nr:Pol [Feline foamy virus]
MDLLKPLTVERKGVKIKGYWDSQADITCVPKDLLQDEEPIRQQNVTTIHGMQEEDVYYVNLKIDGRRINTEVIGTTLDYAIITPGDVPWILKKPLELTIKLDLEEQQRTLLNNSILSKKGKEELKRLFEKYSALWQSWENQVGHRKIRPHKIATGTVKPTPQKQYHINPKAKPDIQIVINDLLKQGVLIQKESTMNTPVYPVPKPNGRWRMVLDYRAVNKVTPLIAVQNQHSYGILGSLFKGRYKTTIDLSNGFWAHPIVPEDYWITAFTWQGKQYCWTVLPQGFLNSPGLFTGDVVDLLQGIPNVEVYVDDVYISHDSEKEHLEYLEILFNRLNEAGYIVSLKKSNIANSIVDFLGFQITNEGRGLTDTFKEKLENITAPTTLKQLQSILGLLNFARNFIPDFTELIAPLYALIPKSTKNYVPWQTEHSTTLETLIAKLNGAEYLQGRRGDKTLIMKVNASYTTGYIRYYNEGEKKPISYVSIVFSKTELKFTELEKLLTTVHKGLLKALDLSMGQNIHVYSPIVSMQNIQKTPQAAKKALASRWLSWLSYLEDPRIRFFYDPQMPALKDLPAVNIGENNKKHPSNFQHIFYTDGSAITSPTKEGHVNAGMGIVYFINKDGNLQKQQEWSISLGNHTAQFAEIAAFEFALKKCLPLGGNILVVTDSNYVAKAYNEELDVWASNGFVNNRKKPLKHISKWKSVADFKKLRPDVVVTHEPGHQKLDSSPHAYGNNLADQLATQASFKVHTTKNPKLDIEQIKAIQACQNNEKLPVGYPKQYTYELRNDKCMVLRKDGWREIPPSRERYKLIKEAHDISHAGREAVLLKIQENYWWPKMKKDISSFLSTCNVCKMVNPLNLKPISPQAIVHPTKPFDKFYMDYIGPLPPSEGYVHVLVVVDAATGFTWLYPTKAQTSKATIKVLNHLTGLAIPKVLHSDQGSAFTSEEFAQWAKEKNIQLEFSTPYHPQSSGKVERKNSEIKKLLTKLLVGRPLKWYNLISSVQLALNNTHVVSTKYTPHQLMFGIDCNLPFANKDTLDWTREEELALLQEIRESLQHPVQPPTSSGWSPYVGQLVQERVYRPSQLRPKWRKPTKVLEILNPRTVIIVDHLGQRKSVSIDNLKPTAHQHNGTRTCDDPEGMDGMECSQTTTEISIDSS